MPETLQEKNKVLLLEGFDVLFNQRDFEAAKRYWSLDYIQHSSHIAPGGWSLQFGERAPGQVQIRAWRNHGGG
jgi:predicted SnoaL-like aldol condensation-catalyzing enzyme